MPDLPLVRFRFYGQGCQQEPTGHLVLSWKPDKAEWRLVDWLRSNGHRDVVTGDDPKNGARKFLEGMNSFIPEWHKAQQDAIIRESAYLGKHTAKTMMQQKGFRPQTAGKRWWLFKTETVREVTFVEKSVASVLEPLRQWLPEATLIVQPMSYPDPWH
jgi:hypothetical protein